MTQILTPAAELDPRGVGVPDLDAIGTVVAENDLEFNNDQKSMLFISNGTVGAVSFTVKSQPNSAGRGGPSDPNNDETISVPAGAVGMFPFLQADGWNTAGGVVQLTTTADPALKVALVKMATVG